MNFEISQKRLLLQTLNQKPKIMTKLKKTIFSGCSTIPIFPKAVRICPKDNFPCYSACFHISPIDSVTLIKVQSAGPDITYVAHSAAANLTSV